MIGCPSPDSSPCMNVTGTLPPIIWCANGGAGTSTPALAASTPNLVIKLCLVDLRRRGLRVPWLGAASDGAQSRRHSSSARESSQDHRDAPRDEPDNSVRDGRSPGSRVSASGHLPGFPVVSWPSAHRLQLRGQPRIWGPMPLEANDP